MFFILGARQSQCALLWPWLCPPSQTLYVCEGDADDGLWQSSTNAAPSGCWLAAEHAAAQPCCPCMQCSAVQRPSLRWQGVCDHRVAVENAVQLHREGRGEADGGRLQAAAARSQTVTGGDKALDG